MNTSSQNNLHTPNPDDIKLDIEPFIIISVSEHEPMIAKIKALESKKKKYILSDSYGNKIYFAEIVLDKEFNNYDYYIIVSEEKKEHTIWFGVCKNSLNAVETDIYKDANDPSASVNFEHIHDLLKLSLALKNENLQERIVVYLTIEDEKLKTLFEDNKNFEFYVYKSLDLWKFMTFAKGDNYIDKESIPVKKCDSLVETMITSIFNVLLKENNFDSFLKMLSLIIETPFKENNFTEDLLDKITELLELIPNSKISIDKKMDYYLNTVSKHKNFNTKDERNIYLESHLNSIILGQNPTMDDLEIYKKYTAEFKIYDETGKRSIEV